MRLIQYIRDTRAEFTHVTWPSKSQSIAYTVLTLIISIAVGAGLGLLDTGLTKLLQIYLQ